MKHKNLIFYFLILISSLVCISFFGGSASYAFFFGVTLIPVVSFLYMLFVLVTFKIYQKTAGRTMVVDEEMEYFFTIQNNTFFSFYGLKILLYSDFFTVKDPIKSDYYMLLPGKTVTYNTKVSCQYRGEYPIGVKSVVISDFLNLFHIKYNISGGINAIVNPKIVRLRKLRTLSGTMATDIQEPPPGSEFVDASVRDYVRGDSINRIHWKATAKTGELKVRNMYNEKKRGTYIYFDGKRESDDISQYLRYENKVLETVIALAAFYSDQNEEVDITISNEIANVYDANTFNQFYSKACAFEFKKSDNNDERRREFLLRCEENKPKTAYFVVGEVSDELLIMSEKLASMSISIVIYVVADGDKEYEHLNLESRNVVRIGTDENLIDIL